MYRFEISGESPEQLHQNMKEFALKFLPPSQQPITVDTTEDEYGYEPMPAVQSVTPSFPNVDTAPTLQAIPPSYQPPVPTTLDQPVYIPQASQAAAVAEKDSRGYPWDERIHSAAQSKNKDGTWRYKKGCPDSQIEQVEFGLKNSLGIVGQTPNSAPGTAPIAPEPAVMPSQPFTAPPPPTSSAPVASPIIYDTPIAIEPVASAKPESYGLPTPTVGAQRAGHTVESFKGNLPMVLADLITKQKIDQEYVNQLKAHFGVAEIWKVNDQQAAEMFQAFVGYGFITDVGQ